MPRIPRVLRRRARRRAEEHPLAIAHDYLTQRGGAERVVLAMHRAFPEAPIYTTLYDPQTTYPEFADADVRVSWLNRIPFFRRHHRAALPLLPLVSSTFRVPARLSLVSTTGWAHGFAMTGARLVYCHSPARWLYLTRQYVGAARRQDLVMRVLAMLRPALIRWDQRAAHHADQPYLANSSVVRDRIEAVYGIRAEVLYPPQGIAQQTGVEPVPGLEEETGFLLVVSRLLPYKNIEKAVEAVSGTDHRLLVVGAGPLERTLRESAPENVRIVSDLTDAQMRWAYRNCAMVLAVSYEDFGITVLEGAAEGRPALALRAGGYLDTVVDGVTGVFVEDLEPETLRAGIARAAATAFDEDLLRDHARGFGQERFTVELLRQVERIRPAD